MKIVDVKVNHFKNPIGYYMEKPCISWKIEDTTSQRQIEASIDVSLTADMKKNIYRIHGNLDQCCTVLDLKLKPKTRYYYQITVVGNNDQALSNIYYFETAKDKQWKGDFIGSKGQESILVDKKFSVKKAVKKARLYICGLGVYEAYLNGQFVNNEYLMPGFHCYNDYLQYQTYDVTLNLVSGENHLNVYLGNGWYRGRLGYEGGFTKIFGDDLAVIFELYVEYEDGTQSVIVSNDQCQIKSSPIIQSGIYDGEYYDANKEKDSKELGLDIIDIDKSKLFPRISLPITIVERRKPIKLIHSKKNEIILDFGQNITGWVEAKVDRDIQMYFCEILQDGCFFNENYRTATYGYRYKSDGVMRHIRPHFTFFGFRYVKIIYDGKIDLDSFEACLISSQIDRIGYIETGSSKVNQLISNVYYSQLDNFLDVPTDCPQRDERLGWTGDAQVFSDTACYNSDVSAFYNKYLFDMNKEQSKRDGGVPNIIPTLKPKIEHYAIEFSRENSYEKAKKLIEMLSSQDSSPWADAATIIPWNVFMHDGDIYQLNINYQNMKAWVDHIIEADKRNGCHRLFDFGFHFADWLSLDNPDGGPFGKTDMYYVSSIFYYYSVTLVYKAAKLLKKDEYLYYQRKAKQIKGAIRDKYIKDGKVNIMTQTAFALAIYFKILNENEIEENVNILEKLICDKGHLDTGFVGTVYINDVLADYEKENLAYDILLNENYPGWLYEINLGATTIWERWNSVLPDGKMNTDGMNSLNHYSYGSILGWMYRFIGGIRPIEPGFKKVLIKPIFDKRIKYSKLKYNSAMGEYKVCWKYLDDNKVNVIIKIPFQCNAKIILPKKEIDCASGTYKFDIIL